MKEKLVILANDQRYILYSVTSSTVNRMHVCSANNFKDEIFPIIEGNPNANLLIFYDSAEQNIDVESSSPHLNRCERYQWRRSKLKHRERYSKVLEISKTKLVTMHFKWLQSMEEDLHDLTHKNKVEFFEYNLEKSAFISALCDFEYQYIFAIFEESDGRIKHILIENKIPIFIRNFPPTNNKIQSTLFNSKNDNEVLSSLRYIGRHFSIYDPQIVFLAQEHSDEANELTDGDVINTKAKTILIEDAVNTLSAPKFYKWDEVFLWWCVNQYKDKVVLRESVNTSNKSKLIATRIFIVILLSLNLGVFLWKMRGEKQIEITIPQLLWAREMVKRAPLSGIKEYNWRYDGDFITLKLTYEQGQKVSAWPKIQNAQIKQEAPSEISIKWGKSVYQSKKANI